MAAQSVLRAGIEVDAVLDSQPFTPFGTPRIEDLAASFGGHAGTKTMGALAMEITRLKCSFHGGCRLCV